MTLSYIPYLNSAEKLMLPGRRSPYGKAAQLALTAIAMGVHAMSASAQTESRQLMEANALVEHGSTSAAGPQIFDSTLARGDARRDFVDGGNGRASSQAGGASLSGVAQGPERIEIRQSGQLVRSTVVPAGPYTLTDLRLVDHTSKVEITTLDCDGGRQTTVVDAASLLDAATMAASSYAPKGVYAEQVQTSRAPDQDAAVLTQPVSAADIDVAPIAANSSEAQGVDEEFAQASDDSRADVVEQPLLLKMAKLDAVPPLLGEPVPQGAEPGQSRPLSAQGAGEIENARTVVETNSKSWDDVRTSSLSVATPLNIQNKPISLAARYALHYPVDSLTAYTTVASRVARQQLMFGLRNVAVVAAPEAVGNRSGLAALAPSQVVADSGAYQSNAGNNLHSLANVRATLAWNTETRAPQPYVYASNTAESAGAAIGLPDVRKRQFDRVDRLAAVPRDPLEGSGSGAISYADSAVPLGKLAGGEWTTSDSPLAGIGSGNLLSGPLSYDSSAMIGNSLRGDGVRAGESALRLFAQSRPGAAYVGS